MLVRSGPEVYWDLCYTAAMARGWESKSVEEQINEREAEAQRPAKANFSPQQRALQSKRDGLLLLRARTLATLQITRNEIYRRQQEHALAHLDAELAELDSVAPKK